LFAIAESQATAHEADFRRFVVNPILKPTRISAAVREKDDRRTIDCGVVALLGPRTHLFSVWRIAENGVRPPVLGEAVILGSKVLRALRIQRRGAGI